MCKRGYQVALTLGNHPVIDLMVVSPNGTQFLVDVKGLHKRAFWSVRPKVKTDKLFYVLAFVPEALENSFFVLTDGEANEGIRMAESSTWPGIDWKFAERFKDKWDSLPK